NIDLEELGLHLGPAARTMDTQDDLFSPEPEFEENFDPLIHNPDLALRLGLDHLEHEVESRENEEWEDSQRIANKCRIALGAFDYLTRSIGLNIIEIFRRHRLVPQVFVPSHVSNKHGLTEKGSLFDLLEDASRAYVCGAPAASIAMCRAALEMILAEHYGLESTYIHKKSGELRTKPLIKLIVLAERKYARIGSLNLVAQKDRADEILHRYARSNKLTKAEDEAILLFIQTLKSLIQAAPV
ncbi:MAG: DUF4145 domain-containing protein, partial [Fimbriimonadaceae bacterium]|nr:DUF4145 domain-containing protein [Alphaproteobacteria bacterium]